MYLTEPLPSGSSQSGCDLHTSANSWDIKSFKTVSSFFFLTYLERIPALILALSLLSFLNL